MSKERHYKCKQCGHSWWQEWDPSADNHVFCPTDNCGEYAGKLRSSSSPALANTTTHSAEDYTFKMMEEQYGIPPAMMNTNQREGDSFVKHSPKAFSGPQANTPQKSVSDILAGSRQNVGVGKNLDQHPLDILKSNLPPDPRKGAMIREPK